MASGGTRDPSGASGGTGKLQAQGWGPAGGEQEAVGGLGGSRGSEGAAVCSGEQRWVPA